MNISRVYKYLFLLIVIWHHAEAKDILPYSAQTSLKTTIVYSDLSLEPIAEPDRFKKNNLSSLKSYAFADRYNTHFTPENSGVWEQTKLGKIWRLGISSPGAFSIYISLGSLKLTPGVRLFVYNQDYKQVQGPFTSENTVQNKALSIPPTEGDKIIVEINMPDNVTQYGDLEIQKVYHDRLNVFGKKTASLSTAASSCDENINCENGTYWQTEKRAVCKIITDGVLCTGTLMANTSHTAAPLLLTAYHTIFDEQHAEQAIFIFNYEYATCATNLADETQTISGATLLASANGLDYALLKLSKIPPPSYKPYYSGWDIAGNANQGPFAAIHHPYGKPKQISITYSGAQSSNFDSFLPNSFWKVSWNIGATEPGSSGCPLFNANHQFIGSLTGGNSSCGQSGNDYFNKLSASWDNLGANDSPLKLWLDSANTGLTSMEGYDPYGFDPSNCEIAWNVSANEVMDSTPLNIPNGGHPALAEKFHARGTVDIPSLYLNISAVSSSDPSDSVDVKLWQGEDKPSVEIYSHRMSLTQLKQGLNEVVLDSVLKIQGTFFIGFEPKFTPSAKLELYHATNRKKEGPSTLYVLDQKWQNIQSIAGESYATSLAIGVSACYGIIDKPNYNSIVIYPNPSTTYLNFQLPTVSAIKSVKCFDTQGKQQQVYFEPGELKNTLYFHLSPAVYFLQVKTGTQVFLKKFIVAP